MLAYVKLAHPKHWTKNLVVLAGPMFGQTFSSEAAFSTQIFFIAFCLVSSASYAINDLLDRFARRHFEVCDEAERAVASILELDALRESGPRRLGRMEAFESLAAYSETVDRVPWAACLPMPPTRRGRRR